MLCQVDTCKINTANDKPYCLEHILEHPYALHLSKILENFDDNPEDEITAYLNDFGTCSLGDLARLIKIPKDQVLPIAMRCARVKIAGIDCHGRRFYQVSPK